MKLLKLLLVLIMVVFVGGTLLLGYFGLIPSISALMGTDIPRDLGMEYSQENYDTGLNRAQGEALPMPEDRTESLAYSGSHEVNDSFPDEELTAHAHSKPWVHYPIDQVQVRINDDNSCEVSAILKLSKVPGFLAAMALNIGDYEKALDQANIPVADVPVYAKGTGTASNNQLSIDIDAIEVGRFPVPKSLIEEHQWRAVDFGHQVMARIDGFSVNEARFDNGSIYFDGTLPDKEFTER